MDILTKSLSLFFRNRLKEIDSFARKADEIQHKQLKRLLSAAKETEWGRRYDYKSILSYSEFKKRIPLQSYEDIKPFVNRMINGEKNILWPSSVRWYAKSSGTTNERSKFLPITHEILQDCHYQGGYDSVALYLRNNPQSRFFRGKGLILGGSHSPSPLNHEAHCGDLSAVLLQNLSPMINWIRVPSKKIILMDEWESKMKAIVENTYNKNVNNLSGVPSWMLVLIKAVLQKTGREYLTEVWPNIEVFFHGGISFEPYREQYRALIPTDRMHYVETYNASEGFFGIQSDLTDNSMLLMLDYGIFYEFISVNELEAPNPSVIPLEAVETGKNYAMVITTSGGLWRYLIGDTVRFTSVLPYKFVISGRTKHYINAFGEELMIDNADKALSRSCKETGAIVKEYTVAPLFFLERAKGRHQWFIEFEKKPTVPFSEFATLLDKHLKELNSDYDAKRYKEISLMDPEIIVAHPGVFYRWLKEKGKLGGQHKIPRLNNDRKHIEELLAINQNLNEK
ncbi:MAG: GH3 auxin-responsive promoter family protein [Massilibacteroides sp.]|nr:GH3 auxin-responsive promoter family protein [Massilibacteroides sp.]MDD3062003.1 GH3 auxin-responsive promoter family protein [Massilibacteroides sp.]MDD4114058.1 GH3 auxin-responsive promoter family protein [Massilibacteroides sp.]MDD4659280.1 GH3 auxin-responsive promoter family protein [Massilibacteroides sp.]